MPKHSRSEACGSGLGTPGKASAAWSSPVLGVHNRQTRFRRRISGFVQNVGEWTSRVEEFDRLGREQFLKRYGFAEAREYLLLFKGRKYDSKAIAGVAHKYQFPEKGALIRFSGGVSSGAAAKKLASLGFEIVTVDHDTSAWTLAECELVAQAYFQCLAEELQGRKINKTEMYRSLASQLGKRTAKSVEYKFQNINAILMEDGLPTLGPPMSNYQNLLKSVVRDYMRTHAHVFEVVPAAPPVPRPTVDIFVAAAKNQKTGSSI